MNMKELLMQEWEETKTELSNLDIEDDSDNYNRLVKRLSDLEGRLVDLEKNGLDNETKVNIKEIENELKSKELSHEKESQKNKNGIEILKIGLPICAAFAMGIISMKWEKVDTLTSTAGKSSLRDVLKFK